MRLCLTVLLCSVFALGRAVACSGPDPLIVDDFSGANRSSWDNQGPVVAIDSQYGSPALTIRPHSHRLAYSLFTPRATGPRAMICTRVRSHGSTGSAGIVFWHAGDDEYYVARFDFSSGKAV